MTNKQFSTEQEAFWAGDFGNEYIGRNDDARLVINNTAFFAQVLTKARQVNSFLELGANIGNNMKALHNLRPDAKLSGVEINQKAFAQLKQLPFVDAINSSLYEVDKQRRWDFVFLKGVLIHLAPEKLNDVYDIVTRSLAVTFCSLITTIRGQWKCRTVVMPANSLSATSLVN